MTFTKSSAIFGNRFVPSQVLTEGECTILTVCLPERSAQFPVQTSLQHS